jgi:hypothetical protein
MKITGVKSNVQILMLLSGDEGGHLDPSGRKTVRVGALGITAVL